MLIPEVHFDCPNCGARLGVVYTPDMHGAPIGRIERTGICAVCRKGIGIDLVDGLVNAEVDGARDRVSEIESSILREQEHRKRYERGIEASHPFYDFVQRCKSNRTAFDAKRDEWKSRYGDVFVLVQDQAVQKADSTVDPLEQLAQQLSDKSYIIAHL